MPVKKAGTRKPAPKKAPAKAAPAKKAPAKKPALANTKKPAKKAAPVNNTRVYHVSKRAEDGKWAVKYAGGEKAIKLFATKAEAEAYTKKMAENQGGVMLTHASKGKKKGKIQ